jgi:hypothetical protein
MPSLAGVIANVEFVEAIRKSQATASAAPPPKQGPSIIAIVGIGIARTDSMALATTA